MSDSLLGGRGSNAARRRRAAEKIVLRVGDWAQLREDAQAVRMAVFVKEQGISPALEMDEHDAGATHAVVFDGNGAPLATGRLLPEGRIGRMAVLAPHRGRGLGATVLRTLIAVALNKGMRELRLHAQASATGFYEREGFMPEGEPYVEAGIPHQTMVRHFPAGA